MSDTYAVINKPKQPHPLSTLAPPTQSRATSPLHHYDNDTPPVIYSAIRKSPRTNQKTATAAAEGPSASENEYEVLNSVCRPEDIGFNFRVQKPKGPRGSPVTWTRPHA